MAGESLTIETAQRTTRSSQQGPKRVVLFVLAIFTVLTAFQIFLTKGTFEDGDKYL
ncbi:hypothetical protein D1872_160120 [compost metagenome]